MKKNLRKALFICTFSPLLMAVLCEPEPDPEFILRDNQTKVLLSEGPTFAVNDTLWISGNVTSMAFDEISGDSIMNPNEWSQDIISVMRLRSAVNTSNTIQAIEEFDLVSQVGSIDFLGVCPESELIAIGPLSETGEQYAYRIGLIPKNTGDFVLSWLDPVNLRNANLNVQILANYPIDGNANTLGLTKCGVTSTRPDVAEARREYFFTVN